jgi:two-component system NtrC family sensor kinase
VVSGDDPIVSANAQQIEQVLTNLIVNAIQAMPQGGQAEIRLGRRRARPPGDEAAPEASYACLSVADEGVGIPGENVSKLFEPFFTTKDVGEGTGLGLSLAYGIVRDHGGWIEVTTEVGSGSCFSVCLPVAHVDPRNHQRGPAPRDGTSCTSGDPSTPT